MKLLKHKVWFALIAASLVVFSTGCDDDFASINTNPNAAIEINPGFQFSLVQLRTSGGRYENWRATLIYSSTMMQHLATTCGYWTGDKYTYNAGYASSLFDRAYPETVKDVQDLINTLEGGEVGDATMLGQARIWRVVIFHRLTDLYGDIPYSEAGKAFLEGIDFPRYDPQEDIYFDMLNELEQATAQLGSGGFGTSDLLYDGDVDKWRRFGYSLMLRLGMRMSEVDPNAAQEWVRKAIDGGVMNSIEDDAFIQHSNGPQGINMNGIGEVLDLANGSAGENCPRLSDTYVSWMKDHNDPRLSVVALPSVNTGEIVGLPNGLDATTIENNPTGTDVEDFSRINQQLVKVSSPMMFMTYSETEFLLAEAAIRGWGASDETFHYNEGVRAAMKLYRHWDPSLAIEDAAIADYLAANPFDGSLEQIGWQYWAVTLFNEYETFSNWRRTGFPELTPINYPGNVTNGQIPLRMAYPQSEAGRPPFEEAVARQSLGTDFASYLTVPVWWDE